MAANQADGLRRLSSVGGGGSVVSLDQRRARTIAVTGGKGGVGKSTVSVNLAATYARRGAKTLMVDGDLGMADLNLLLGLAPDKSLLDVLDGAPIEEIIVEAHGMSLIPALNGSHRLANLADAERAKIMGVIDGALARFETLVVDIPAGIGQTAMTLAGAVCDVVVVTTPEPLSLADAYACMKVLTMRHGLQRAFVVPNSVRSPSQADEVVQRLRSLVDRFLGIQLVPLPAVPWDATVAQAAAAGVPLVLHSPETPAARAIRRLAQQLDALAADPLLPGDRPRFKATP
jgi:flagellar biosynthesis protein FlhG